jgi:CRISPR-associated endonuclease Csn1
MSYVLGLDLGTSSIGVAALSLNAHNEPQTILDHDVYLFKEPVTSNSNGSLVSKKANRRANRQARKQRDRRSGRLQDLAQLCRRHFSADAEQPMLYPDVWLPIIKQYQSLALRAYAAKHPVPLSDLTAIVLHLSKSRGYSSGFKPMSVKKQEQLKETEDLDARAKIITGEVAPGHDRLAHILQLRGCDTVGEYLLDRAKRGLPSILKATDRSFVPSHCQPIDEEIETQIDRKSGEVLAQNFHNLYALRDEVKAEFKVIWDMQATHQPSLTPELSEQFNQVLFHQRPLKSVMPMVGGCMVEPNLPRATRAHPAFQTFRIEKQLADLRWGYGRNAKHLSTIELDIIREALNNPSQLDASAELSFDKIYKLLASLREADAPHNLNLAKGGRDGLKGNITNKRWGELKLFEAWDALAKAQPNDPPHLNRQTWVTNFLSDLGSEESLFSDNWCEQFYLPDLDKPKTERKQINGAPRATVNHAPRVKKQAAMFTDPLFIDFINQFRTHEKYGRLSGLKFDGGRASYSIKALNKINGWLHTQIDLGDNGHVDEHQAIKALYAQSQTASKVLDKLDNPAKTGNGVVDLALMQVKKVVNHYIALHGKPQRIVVEMAREMSEGITRRNDIQSGQYKQNQSHKKATDDMAANGVNYSKTNVLRYRLAQDQGYACPYCTGKFGARDIYDGAATNIEHIIPQAISQVGRKYSEIVLAHRGCNDRKGKNVPMQAFAFNTAPIEAMAKHLRSIKQDRKALLLELPENPNGSGVDELAFNEFCERQFHETAWITKLTATWLRSLGINVECTNGKMTAQLRKQWQLESVIPESRIIEGLPVYSTNTPDGEIKETIIPAEAMHDEDGNQTLLWRYWNDQRITKDEFDELRQTGLYRYDKRCDHRHHLIDAITVALCDRGMVKYMADEYKKRSEQEAQKPLELQRNIRFGRIACPVPDLRGQVLTAVKAQKVTHRPDRNVSGAWFQETAYGLYVDQDNGNQKYLANRISVRGLIDKDQAATVANIESVIGIEVRKALHESYQAHCQTHFESGQARNKEEYAKVMESLWLTPPIHQRMSRPIVKVKQIKVAYLEGKHVIIKHPNRHNDKKPIHHKVLISDENAYFAWNPANPTEGFKAVSNYDVNKKNAVPENWWRVHKGDTVRAKDGLLYVSYGLSEAKSAVQTMRLVCTTTKTRQLEGQRDFKLDLARRAGSMSLWDITEIISDPFEGDPQHG